MSMARGWRLLTQELDLPVVMRPTEGPSQNILLLETGEIQIGFVTQGVALGLEQWRRCDWRTPSAGHACDVPNV